MNKPQHPQRDTAKIRRGLVVIDAHLEEGWERCLSDDLARQIIIQIARPLLVMKRQLLV
jgi:hypothetical protein